NMEVKKVSRSLLMLASFCFISSVVSAQSTTGLYMNGQWDNACAKCWPSPRTPKNNHCKPEDCALQGYYHCKMQNPPLSVDDDPRLFSLIQSGQCTYAPSVSFNAGEAEYIKSLNFCINVLDKMAGRFNLPADPKDVARVK